MSLVFRSRRSLIGLALRDDPTAELERLSGLHDSGALTDDEFAVAKAKLLGLLPKPSRGSRSVPVT